jgi:hypothetical protein
MLRWGLTLVILSKMVMCSASSLFYPFSHNFLNRIAPKNFMAEENTSFWIAAVTTGTGKEVLVSSAPPPHVLFAFEHSAAVTKHRLSNFLFVWTEGVPKGHGIYRWPNGDQVYFVMNSILLLLLSSCTQIRKIYRAKIEIQTSASVSSQYESRKWDGWKIESGEYSWNGNSFPTSSSVKN